MNRPPDDSTYDVDTPHGDSDVDSEPDANQASSSSSAMKPWARLVAIQRSNPDIDLWEEDSIVGRGNVNGNKRVSKFHCRIHKEASGRIYVNNLSENGVLVNGSSLENGDARSVNNGDGITLGLISGSPQYILHVHDNRQNKLVKDVTVSGKQTNEQLLKLKDDLTCPICLSLFHDVVTIAPCLHNFCNGCFSRWYKNNRMSGCNCPQCREAVVFVKRNHTLHNIIQNYLKESPSWKRPDEEITRLNQISIVGSNYVKIGTGDNDDGSESDGNDGQYCPQCPRRNLSIGGAFRCGLGSRHILCSTCNKLMPDRSDVDIPQKCAGCHQAFCGLYWNSQNIGSSRPNCMMKKMNDQNFEDFPAGAFLGNAYEQDVTKRYMREHGVHIHDVVLEDFQKMCMGIIGMPEFLTGPFTRESYFCKQCAEIIVAHLLYEFRLSIPRNELPSDAAGRENCWYGRLCRTQRHNVLHTQNYNHACEPLVRGAR